MIVVSNGSIVMIDNEIIFESVIENELKEKLVEVAKKYNATLSLLTHEHIYTNVINYYVDKALTPRDEGSLIDLNGYNNLDINPTIIIIITLNMNGLNMPFKR